MFEVFEQHGVEDAELEEFRAEESDCEAVHGELVEDQVLVALLLVEGFGDVVALDGPQVHRLVGCSFIHFSAIGLRN